MISSQRHRENITDHTFIWLDVLFHDQAGRCLRYFVKLQQTEGTHLRCDAIGKLLVMTGSNLRNSCAEESQNRQDITSLCLLATKHLSYQMYAPDTRQRKIMKFGGNSENEFSILHTSMVSIFCCSTHKNNCFNEGQTTVGGKTLQVLYFFFHVRYVEYTRQCSEQKV